MISLDRDKEGQVNKSGNVECSSNGKGQSNGAGQARKQERTDKHYQEKLNSARMGQMLGGGGSWQLRSSMRCFGCFDVGEGNVMDG
jgi:hypothetical protein